MALGDFFSPWILQLVAMLLTIALIPKLELKSISGLVLLLGAIALVNTFLWDPNLFFSLPSSFTFRAAQLLVVNGLIFWLLVKILPGVETEGVLPCVLAPVLFTCCSVLAHQYAGKVDWSDVFAKTSTFALAASEQLKAYFNSAK